MVKHFKQQPTTLTKVFGEYLTQSKILVTHIFFVLFSVATRQELVGAALAQTIIECERIANQIGVFPVQKITL